MLLQTDPPSCLANLWFLFVERPIDKGELREAYSSTETARATPDDGNSKTAVAVGSFVDCHRFET